MFVDSDPRLFEPILAFLALGMLPHPRLFHIKCLSSRFAQVKSPPNSSTYTLLLVIRDLTGRVFVDSDTRLFEPILAFLALGTLPHPRVGRGVQGYLAHNKHPPPRTTVGLYLGSYGGPGGGGAVSYKKGSPLGEVFSHTFLTRTPDVRADFVRVWQRAQPPHTQTAGYEWAQFWPGYRGTSLT